VVGRVVGRILAEVLREVLPVLFDEWRKGRQTLRAEESPGYAERIRQEPTHVDPKAETEALER